jgi:hypothetical protein
LAEHEFCRSCGANLFTVKERRGVPSPIVGVILAFVGILIALTGRMLLNENIVVFVGVVTSIIGMMSIAVIPLIAAKQSRERTRRTTVRPPSLKPVDTTTKLPPISAQDQIHSVVDDTTELLREPVPGQVRR